MPTAESGLLSRYPHAVRRRISVAEYHRMGEVGILAPDDRIELIEGEIVLMAPIGSAHSGTMNALTRTLVLAVGDRAVVSVQNPLALDHYSEPEPDFTVLRPRADDYRRATPRAADVLLLIEVAASSLEFDRRVKAPLHARHGIPEFWIVDVEAGVVEIRTAPEGDRYTRVETRASGVLEPASLPGVAIPVAAIIG